MKKRVMKRFDSARASACARDVQRLPGRNSVGNAWSAAQRFRDDAQLRMRLRLAA